jgi:hypothetical protein
MPNTADVNIVNIDLHTAPDTFEVYNTVLEFLSMAHHTNSNPMYLINGLQAHARQSSENYFGKLCLDHLLAIGKDISSNDQLDLHVFDDEAIREVALLHRIMQCELELTFANKTIFDPLADRLHDESEPMIIQDAMVFFVIQLKLHAGTANANLETA